MKMLKNYCQFFFEINEIEILKGEKKKSKMFPKLFARNFAFSCTSIV
jgi:hypothetical protein